MPSEPNRGRLVTCAMKALDIAIIAAVPILAGCASIGIGTGSRNPEAMACNEIDTAIGNNAKEISAVAINRGKVDNFSAPFWVPGEERAKSAIRQRQTARIEKLQAEQSAMRTSRTQRCG